MEIFYSYDCGTGRVCRLDAEESAHCIKVLRHKAGDIINVIDGCGTMYECRLVNADARGAQASVLESHSGWGGHPYRLTLGCCPTKNNDRFEWFVEKATELGVDVIAPLIGERSERKVYKSERARRIALSATKQSLKSRIPEVAEPVSVKEFIQAGADVPGLRLIACCFEGETPRTGITGAVREYFALTPEAERNVTVLIGPEGDFSPEEAALAVGNGYVPVHIGPSRLRTETAAVAAAAAVYLETL